MMLSDKTTRNNKDQRQRGRILRTNTPLEKTMSESHSDKAAEAASPDTNDETTESTESTAGNNPENEEKLIIDEPENALPPITLDDLPEKLKAAVARAGWTSLMPVQARAMPYLFAHRDMMVQSRTGSGKTGAFLLPILDQIDPKLAECQALILAPTRELARQVAKEAETIFADTGIRTIAVYGGVGYGPQNEAFRKGAHLVVGTPGRVLDHLMRRNLTLDHLKSLVLDEADRMLSMGFYPDMVEVQSYIPPKSSGHQVDSHLFSATFPVSVIRLADRFLDKPGFLSLSRDHVHVTDTEHSYCLVAGAQRERHLIRLLEAENPASAIIFCNMKSEVRFVSTVLQRFGYDADELSADLGQNDRERVLARVRAGTLRFLVATDVAARGIDIHELSHVIQYSPPEDPEAYIHRAGRTGRAGASGTAITLVDFIELTQLNRIGKRYGIDMEEKPMPTDEDVAEVVSERITGLLEAQLRGRDRVQTERMRRFLPLVRSLGEDEDEMLLMAMLLDEFYQKSLHTPVMPTGEASSSRERSKARSEKERGRSRSGDGRSDRGRSDRGGGGGGRRRGRGRRN